ncbi:MAG: VPLPA-CTERM sorting domain-containing protein [Pseudomonadota bacterium]
MINTRNAIGAALVALATTFATDASSATVFFGEDTNPGGTVPSGGASETARNDFLSNLSGVSTEDFEGLSGSADGATLNFTGSAGTITADLSGTGSFSSGVAGRFPTSGTTQLGGITNGFTLAFDSAVAAFGFYGTDIGDYNGQITLNMSGGSSQSFTVNNTVNGPNGSLLFWGIIADDASETFTSVSFGNTAAGSDYFGFDDLTVGDLDQVSPVPVPASVLLLGSAVAGLGLARRRRKVAADTQDA